MDEATCLSKMIAPGQIRPNKPYFHGVIQIHITRSCNFSCVNCTQLSNVGGKTTFMSPEQFEQAVDSLQGYFGVYGVFGGCPTISPYFHDYCSILQKKVPQERCGLWANNLMGKGEICRKTFSPIVSNLNCHLDRNAYNEMKRDWPESRPFGLDQDSRHAAVYVSMKDIGIEEDKRWDLISRCTINQLWSALIGVFRGELRGWFCEIAGGMSMIHQWDKEWPNAEGEGPYSYPDTGIPIKPNDNPKWWQRDMFYFREQVREHCHNCSIPLNGYGSLSQDENGVEQVSEYHANVYKPKRKGRKVDVVTHLEQLGIGRINRVIDYLQNANK